jgi:hypothetical protein
MNEQKVANSGPVELTAAEIAGILPSLVAFIYSGALIQELSGSRNNRLRGPDHRARARNNAFPSCPGHRR